MDDFGKYLVELSEAMECGICGKRQVEPTVLPCQHSFCGDCANMALFSSTHCPTCKQPCWRKDAAKNYELRSIIHGIQAYFELEVKLQEDICKGHFRDEELEAVGLQRSQEHLPLLASWVYGDRGSDEDTKSVKRKGATGSKAHDDNVEDEVVEDLQELERRRHDHFDHDAHDGLDEVHENSEPQNVDSIPKGNLQQSSEKQKITPFEDPQLNDAQLCSAELLQSTAPKRRRVKDEPESSAEEKVPNQVLTIAIPNDQTTSEADGEPVGEAPACSDFHCKQNALVSLSAESLRRPSRKRSRSGEFSSGSSSNKISAERTSICSWASDDNGMDVGTSLVSSTPDENDAVDLTRDAVLLVRSTRGMPQRARMTDTASDAARLGCHSGAVDSAIGSVDREGNLKERGATEGAPIAHGASQNSLETARAIVMLSCTQGNQQRMQSSMKPCGRMNDSPRSGGEAGDKQPSREDAPVESTNEDLRDNANLCSAVWNEKEAQNAKAAGGKQLAGVSDEECDEECGVQPNATIFEGEPGESVMSPTEALQDATEVLSSVQSDAEDGGTMSGSVGGSAYTYSDASAPVSQGFGNRVRELFELVANGESPPVENAPSLFIPDQLKGECNQKAAILGDVAKSVDTSCHTGVSKGHVLAAIEGENGEPFESERHVGRGYKQLQFTKVHESCKDLCAGPEEVSASRTFDGVEKENKPLSLANEVPKHPEDYCVACKDEGPSGKTSATLEAGQCPALEPASPLTPRDMRRKSLPVRWGQDGLESPPSPQGGMKGWFHSKSAKRRNREAPVTSHLFKRRTPRTRNPVQATIAFTQKQTK